MERLAAKMGGTVKFPFNESECLDADYFKVPTQNALRYVFDEVMYSDNLTAGRRSSHQGKWSEAPTSLHGCRSNNGW